jgi:hypothetical protein
MFSDNTFSVRFATDGDADVLRRLAARNFQPELTGRILIAETRGGDVAASSLDDGRAIGAYRRLAGPRPGS